MVDLDKVNNYAMQVHVKANDSQELYRKDDQWPRKVANILYADPTVRRHLENKMIVKTPLTESLKKSKLIIGLLENFIILLQLMLFVRAFMII